MKWRLIPQTEQGGGMNKRRELVIALGASALVASLDSFARQQGRVWRVGVFDTSTSMNATQLEAFRKGLRELGYVEGENLIIDKRSTPPRPERLAELASALVRAKVYVIVAERDARISGSQECHRSHSHRRDRGRRPGGNRARKVSVTPRRECHRVEFCLRRLVRETGRVDQRDGSRSQTNRCPGEPA